MVSFQKLNGEWLFAMRILFALLVLTGLWVADRQFNDGKYSAAVWRETTYQAEKFRSAFGHATEKAKF